MTREEAARALGVAPSEVRDVEETGDGARVRMTNGAVRLIVPGDGVFACDDHPASAHLRRWEEPEPDAPAGTDADADSDGGEDAVPNGNIDEVMAWVGDDPERALAALEAERARDKPRKGLVDRLVAFATAGGGEG